MPLDKSERVVKGHFFAPMFSGTAWLSSLIKRGLTPLEAIRAATTTGSPQPDS